MRIVRYLFAGGVAALVDWSIFWGLANELQLQYQIAATISFLLATLTNYIVSIRYVFESGVRYSRRREAALVYLVSALGLGINLIVLQILVGGYGFHLMVAKISATAIVFFWNYFSRATFIFKSDPKA
ncbi:GtrA family protein [Methylibium sp.]|uniref:GtrA family protein n=1 Tax=Methylibium sp. TaxID=2067992 RepID=UPI003D1525EE